VGCLTGYFILPQKSLCSAPKGLPSMRQRLFCLDHDERGSIVTQDEEIILRYAKEIIVKFIELGRVSPSSFGDQFRNIYWGLKNTLVDARLPKLDEDFPGDDPAQDG
jgi:hypothetical protein